MAGTPRIYEKFYITLMKKWRIYCENKVYRHYKKLIGKHKELIPLSDEQKKEVRSLWKKYGKFNYNTHELCYWVTGTFDPHVVPVILLQHDIEMGLNFQMGKTAWSDKNIFDMIIDPKYLPYTVFRGMDGAYYNNGYEYLSYEELKEKIMNYPQSLIYKPALDTGEGNGICMVDKDELKKMSYLKFRKKYGSNWLMQELVKPCDVIKSLNDTALSIMRLVTFYIDGNVYMTSASMRIGIKGALTDYTKRNDGMTSFIVGINKDGSLKEIGYYPAGVSSDKTPCDTPLSGVVIPKFDEAVSLVRSLHKKLPHYRFVSWDVTVDDNGAVKIIEFNVNGSGCLYYQYVNGSLFGEYEEEILSGLKRNGVIKNGK